MGQNYTSIHQLPVMPRNTGMNKGNRAAKRRVKLVKIKFKWDMNLASGEVYLLKNSGTLRYLYLPISQFSDRTRLHYRITSERTFRARAIKPSSHKST